MFDDQNLDMLLQQPMQDVDKIIEEQLQSNIPLIAKTASHVIKAGGKRLRPIITLLSGMVLGPPTPMLTTVAAIIECIHSATLLHDDVVDEASLRRGKTSANRLFGNATSVLVGDFLYSRAFQMMVSTQDLLILEVIAASTTQIAEGEMMQMANIGNMQLDEKTYLSIIHKKTAQLFETATQVAALTAKTSSTFTRALMAYGINIGMAFQLMDDALDYLGDPTKTGKALGADLIEGKLTLPLIFLTNQRDPLLRAMVKKALFSDNPKTFQKILQAMKKTGALTHTIDQAKRSAKKATDAIACLPKNPAKLALVKLATWVSERSF